MLFRGGKAGPVPGGGNRTGKRGAGWGPADIRQEVFPPVRRLHSRIRILIIPLFLPGLHRAGPRALRSGRYPAFEDFSGNENHNKSVDPSTGPGLISFGYEAEAEDQLLGISSLRTASGRSACRGTGGVPCGDRLERGRSPRRNERRAFLLVDRRDVVFRKGFRNHGGKIRRLPGLRVFLAGCRRRGGVHPFPRLRGIPRREEVNPSREASPRIIRGGRGNRSPGRSPKGSTFRTEPPGPFPPGSSAGGRRPAPPSSPPRCCR